MINRRRFLQIFGSGSAVLLPAGRKSAFAALAGGTLRPNTIPKYMTPLVIPRAMPRSAVLLERRQEIDYYEIAVRQFRQQILPPRFPATTVWGYGSVNAPGAAEIGGSFSYPAFTIEAKWNRAHFDLRGLVVWHCHILEHEDNQMMRPYRVS